MHIAKRRVVALLTLPVLVFVGATYVLGQVNSAPPSPSALNYRDYSNGGSHHSALKGIQLKANSVKFIGAENLKVLGTELKFHKFEVVAPVTVQTSCNYVSGTFDTAVARYSLSVAFDTKDIARQEFLRQIQSYWTAKSSEELRDYKYLPAEKFLWQNSGRYVLYSQPHDEWPDATYLLYTSGKVLRITFKGFQSGNGWGGLSTFLHDNLLFKFSDTQIRCGYTPDISPNQFLARYNSGFFQEPPKP